MLSELYITNIAIISEETLKFDDKFTVITGETGAGKSIIIDSIDLILGARASKEIIRYGEDKAKVIAVFTSLPKSSIDALQSFGIECEDGECTISREIMTNGSSNARINGKPVSISFLRDISQYLINIHGQHSNQALLNEENHIMYLDAFSDLETEKESYSKLYDEANTLRSKILSLTRDEREKARRIEMLKFQIHEIKSAALKPNEEEELIKFRKKAENAETLSKCSKLVTRALYRNDKGASSTDLVKKSIDAIERIKDIVPDSDKYIEYLNEFIYKCEEISDAVSKECETDIEDPNVVIDKIETRLDLIHTLQKKYGNTVDEIIKFKEDAEKELKEIESSSELIEQYNDELKKILKSMTTIAQEIHNKRVQASTYLEKRMTDELEFLEMNKVKFKIDIKKSGFKNDGFDDVSFLISANAGEPLAPLSKIASGGELSRTMLALKCALADKEMTPTLIFDEIDTGISGKTSYKIGIKLHLCSETCQIICVTHSPQIASVSDTHIYVSKFEKDGRTYTDVKVLDFDERVHEIARIIGGEAISEKTLHAAEDMMKMAHAKK